jgi:hypothetical protein
MNRRWACLIPSCLLVALAGSMASASDAFLLTDFAAPDPLVLGSELLRSVDAEGGRHAEIALASPWTLRFAVGTQPDRRERWARATDLVVTMTVDAPVRIAATVSDAKSRDWFSRYNQEAVLAPGEQHLAVPLDALFREDGSGPLDRTALTEVAITFTAAVAAPKATIRLDRARLIVGMRPMQMLFSFEGEDPSQPVLEDYPESYAGSSAMTAVPDHVTDGATALRLDSRSPFGNVQFSGFPADWRAYEQLAFDVHVLGEKLVTAGGWIRCTDPRSSWEQRYSWARVLGPGQQTIRIPFAWIWRQDGKPFDLADVRSFNLSVDHASIIIDSVRLIGRISD